VKTLHLLDPGALGGGAMTVRALADHLSFHPQLDRVIVLGHRGHARLAQRCGVPIDGLVANPVIHGLIGPPRGLRRLMRQLAGAHGEFDIVHAWSIRSGALAAQLAGELACVISAMIGPAREGALGVHSGWALARALEKRQGPTCVIAAHQGVANELARCGVRAAHLAVAPPGVDASLLLPHRQRSRLALREQWGVSDSTLLVGLISQPISWGNARAAASVVTLPVTANRDVKLLAHPDAIRLHEAYTWARPLRLDGALLQEDSLAEPWTVLRGVDVALWMGGPCHQLSEHARRVGEERMPSAVDLLPMPGVLPLLWAMAAGLPIVAERYPASQSVLAEGEACMMIEPGDVTSGAEAMIRLHDDESLRHTLGHAAQRLVAEDSLALHAFERTQAVYARLLGASTSSARAEAEHHAIVARSSSNASAAPT